MFLRFFRCPDYTNLPLGCNMVKVTGQCCPVVNCTAGSTGTFVGSGTIPTIGGYPIPSIKPTAAPNPLNPGGPTVAPQLVPKQIGGWTEIENSNYAVLRNWIIWLFLKVGWDTLQSLHRWTGDQKLITTTVFKIWDSVTFPQKLNF